MSLATRACAATTASWPKRCAAPWPLPMAMALAPMPSDEDDEDETAIEAHTPFFGTPLPPPGPQWQQVLLPQLQEFFRNPCRALLRRRLGIELAREAEELQDDEPFLADAGAGRALAQRLLPLLLDGADPATLPALARAGTELPEGALGEAQLNQELQALQDFAARLREALAEAPLPPQSLRLDADIEGEAWQLQAAFADLRASGLLRWRFGTCTRRRLPRRLAAAPGAVRRRAARRGAAHALAACRWRVRFFALRRCRRAAGRAAGAVPARAERAAALLPAHVLGIHRERPAGSAACLARQ